jgi:hypothetical protein
VEIAKVAVDCPDKTVTVAGTVTAGMLLVSATVTPPDAAGLSMVTVPVAGLPPTTVLGLTLTETSPGGRMVRVAVTFVPGVAVRVAAVRLETGTVFTVKVVEVWPEGTVTVVGAMADELLHAILMIAPPGGAAVESVSVAVEGEPPSTVVGLRVKEIA